MSRRIVYSSQARQDLKNTFEYVCYELCVPDVATKQSRKIMKSIRSLEDMPLRHRLYDDEPWHAIGLRFFPVDSYLVFYLPNETEEIVNIVRTMYGGRDIQKQLNETIDL